MPQQKSDKAREGYSTPQLTGHGKITSMTHSLSGNPGNGQGGGRRPHGRN